LSGCEPASRVVPAHGEEGIYETETVTLAVCSSKGNEAYFPYSGLGQGCDPPVGAGIRGLAGGRGE